MLSFLKSIRWSAVWVPKLPSWTIDRNWNRVEGERLLAAHAYAEAESYLTLAVAEADRNSLSMVKRGQFRLKLAEAQRKLGKWADAEQTIRKASDNAARSSDRNGYLSCLDALAEVFLGKEDYDSAEKLLQEGLRYESALPHPDPLRMARRVHRLGAAHYKSVPSRDALPALQKGLEMHEKVYGPEHEETMRVASDLGAIYRAQGMHQEAQRCLRRSLRYFQRTLGIEDPRSIHDLRELAGSLEDSGDLEGAGVEYERVITAKQQAVGGDAEDLAELQFSLATLYTGWGKYPRARELLFGCIGTFKRKAGARLAVAYECLAQVEEYSGRFHDAVRELELAGKVWERLPERTAEFAANLEYRAELLDQLRRKRESASLRKQAANLTSAT
jgi:tetratricopeptide (TPR) repeat protein